MDTIVQALVACGTRARPRRRLAATLMASVMAVQMAFASQGRAPIHKATVITDPGSYVVTKDITDTVSPIIDIQASDVTIDLDGHTIASTVYTNILIRAVDQTNIRITNGKLTKGSTGVSLSLTSAGPSSFSVQVDHLELRRQENYGIFIAGYDTGICPPSTCKPAVAFVEDNNVDGEGIADTCLLIRYARDSFITRNVARGASNVLGAHGISGEYVYQTFVTDNVASGNSNNGIVITGWSCDISRNILSGNSAGLMLYGNGNAIRSNTLSNNTKYQGLYVKGHYNSILDNTVAGNTGTGNPVGYGIVFGDGGSTDANYNVAQFNYAANNQGYGIHANSSINNCFRDNSTPGNLRDLSATPSCDSNNLP